MHILRLVGLSFCRLSLDICTFSLIYYVFLWVNHIEYDKIGLTDNCFFCATRRWYALNKKPKVCFSFNGSSKISIDAVNCMSMLFSD